MKKITLVLFLLPFAFHAQCDLTDTTLFTGDYFVTQITPSIFGYDTFSPDGNPVLLTLYSEETDSSQQQPAVTLPDDVRSFDAFYIASLGFDNEMTYAIEFNTDCESTFTLSVPEISNITGLTCNGGSIFLGPATGGFYDELDDEEFNFVFQDDVLDDCGQGAPDVELLFTRDEPLSVNDTPNNGFSFAMSSNNILNISSRGIPMDKFILYNLQGSMVLTEIVDATAYMKDLSNLSAGLYIAKVTNGSFQRSFKFVVQ